MQAQETLQSAPAKRYCSPIAMMVVMTIATAATSFCMMKFPPIMTYVMANYEVRQDLMGLLMSSTNIVGFIFAVAIGYANRNYKPKWTGFLGFAVMALANIMAMNTHNFAVLIISRVIEGTGMGILSNLTIALVVTYFKGARATATAIVNAGMTAGEVIHYNVAPRLAESAGGSLRDVYLYIIATFVVMAVVMLVFLWREPSIANGSREAVPKSAPTEADKARKAEVLRNKSLWLVAIAMFIFNFVMISFSQYAIDFMGTKGIDNVTASTLTSVASSIRTVMMIVVGILADRISSKRKPAMAGFVGIAIMYLLLAILPGNMIMVYIVLSAVVPSPITVSTYSCYPDIFGDASYTPVAHGVVQTMARLSMLVGSTIMGFLITNLGYLATIYILIPLALAAACCWFFAKRVK